MSRSARISTANREGVLDALESECFDCAIIGGGISGAGAAREAQRRGFSVALLEADDFSAGTSSRSSKLIHGGLRYLAQGDVALVRETALERRRVRELAPHLAEPSWMLVPARSRARLLRFRTGIATYEQLGAVSKEDRHRSLGGEDLASEEPHLERERYPWACAYREYLTDDSRLVLANLRSAAESGARIVNHLRVQAILSEGSRACGVEALCALTDRRVRVRARCVVNAAGPWVETLRRLEDGAAAPKLLLSKGVHVVVPRELLPVRNLVILGTPDKRSIFAIARADVVYLGTTDTFFAGAARTWPKILREDVRYLLDPITRYFDVQPIEPERCIAAWAGLRPLIAQAGKTPREVSRRDEIWAGPAGVLTVAGGKLTGYRKMAERVVERIAGVLDAPTPPQHEPDRPLPGGDFDGDLGALARQLRERSGVDATCSERLARLYGSEAASVVALGADPLVPDAPVLEGEVVWGVECEGAARVTDVLYRRTRAALFVPHARRGMAAAIGRIMAEQLGWSAAQLAREIELSEARLVQDLDFGEKGS